MTEPEPRIYHAEHVVRFRKTGEAFGGLSNMAPGFPLQVGSIWVRTSEALYQACRFPHIPELQRMIVAERSPMTAKMRSKPYREETRPDWINVRIPIMRWCLRVKLACNWSSFSSLLHETGDKPIVEDSRKDRFWGAVPEADGTLCGENVLGRLLMELRDKMRSDPDTLHVVQPLRIAHFRLLGESIPAITNHDLIGTWLSPVDEETLVQQHILL